MPLRTNGSPRILGRGTFAVVFEGREPNVVDKLHLPDEGGGGGGLAISFWKELDALRSLPEHPNAVRLLRLSLLDDAVQTPTVMTMQRFRSSLWAFLATQAKRHVARRNQVAADRSLQRALAVQVTRGLRHLHDNGIVHRDLKPNNVLVREEDGVVVAAICDLGSSIPTFALSGGAKWRSTTPMAYRAPEQLTPKGRQFEEPSQFPVTEKVDLWSLGIVLLWLGEGAPQSFSLVDAVTAMTDSLSHRLVHVYLQCENIAFVDKQRIMELRCNAAIRRVQDPRDVATADAAADAATDDGEAAFFKSLIRRLLVVSSSQRPSARETLASIDDGRGIASLTLLNRFRRRFGSPAQK